MTIKFKVEIIESERGWGMRLDEVKLFDDAQEAFDWVEEFNASNNKDETPDWYMVANPQKWSKWPIN